MHGLRALFGAIALAGLAHSAFAQPPGSYRQSCSSIRLQGSTLTAVCRAADGRRVQTALGVAHCVGDIGNNNGQLQCNGGRAVAPPRGPGGAPGYGEPGYGGPGYGGPGYPSAPGETRGPGYRSGGYAPGPNYGEGQASGERCDRLEHEARELRERLQHTPYGDDQERLEHRLREVSYQQRQCWHH